jgi:acyl-coenzyme A thioesterase PaaI-like protein
MIKGIYVPMKKSLDTMALFSEKLGEDIKKLTLPPPIFETMQCEVVDYNEEEKKLTAKMPVLKQWLNPYGTMQGGMIDAAIDNAVGPLSLLLAPMNMTRSIESKFLKPIVPELEYIYVKAKLVEKEKRRLTFKVKIENNLGEIYAQATVINYIIV